MSENNNTTNTKEKQYRHLKKEDRIKIESLINQKDKNGKRLFNNTYIANYLGVNKSTISRELKKRRKEKMYIRTGKTRAMPYTAEYAQENADFKRGLSKGEYKLRKNKKLAKFIEDKIKIEITLNYKSNKLSSYMKTAVQTLKKYLPHIKNTLSNPYSNDFVEGNNNFIKVLKRIAFGFRTFRRFKTRSMICKNLLHIKKANTY